MCVAMADGPDHRSCVLMCADVGMILTELFKKVTYLLKHLYFAKIFVLVLKKIQKLKNPTLLPK